MPQGEVPLKIPQEREDRYTFTISPSVVAEATEFLTPLLDDHFILYQANKAPVLDSLEDHPVGKSPVDPDQN